MLIHKETLGVLDEYWTGKYYKGKDGKKFPQMENYSLDDVDYSFSDWWEVPRGSSIGKKAILLYPWCKAIVGEDGSLIDIVPETVIEPQNKKEPSKTKKPQPAKRKQRLRRQGLFEKIFEEAMK